MNLACFECRGRGWVAPAGTGRTITHSHAEEPNEHSHTLAWDGRRSSLGVATCRRCHGLGVEPQSFEAVSVD